MTPREVIQRTIHFADPPRFGLYFGRFGVDDTVDVFDFFRKDENGVDPWGIKWTVHPDVPSIGYIQSHPVKSRADLDKIVPPDPKVYAEMTVENLRNLTPEQREKYRFVATSSGIWERIQYYRGMEQIFEDLVFDEEMVDYLLNLCTDFWVAYINELTPVKDELDAIYMFDDWGTQSDIMIGLDMWRRFFAENYRRITDAAHANGMDFWLHSCGRVTNLIGDFIDVGMDLVNPYQSGACGYEEVAERYAGKIAFMTTVDTQSTLTHGTPDEVRAEVQRLQHWSTPHGGLIAASYNYDTPEENERVVFDYFRGMKPGDLAKG